MLELAYSHKEQLLQEYTKNLHRIGNYYTLFNYSNYTLTIDDNSIKKEQWVSVRKIVSSVLINGYLCAYITRPEAIVYQISILSFENCNKIIFGRDILSFLKKLIQQYNKVTFCVIVGSPTEPYYDRIVQKLGGRIVGTFHKEHLDIKNQWVDVKYYEIFKAI